MSQMIGKSTDAVRKQPTDGQTLAGMKQGQSFAQEMTRALEKDLAWVNRAIGVLEDQIRALQDGPEPQPVPGDEIDDEETYSTMLVKLKRRARVLSDALHRLDLKTYGLCLSCGRRIPPRQLRESPERTICVVCEGKLREDLARVLNVRSISRSSELTSER